MSYRGWILGESTIVGCFLIGLLWRSTSWWERLFWLALWLVHGGFVLGIAVASSEEGLSPGQEASSHSLHDLAKPDPPRSRSA